jgi:hypothetical protein
MQLVARMMFPKPSVTRKDDARATHHLAQDIDKDTLSHAVIGEKNPAHAPRRFFYQARRTRHELPLASASL